MSAEVNKDLLIVFLKKLENNYLYAVHSLYNNPIFVFLMTSS